MDRKIAGIFLGLSLGALVAGGTLVGLDLADTVEKNYCPTYDTKAALIYHVVSEKLDSALFEMNSCILDDNGSPMMLEKPNVTNMDAEKFLKKSKAELKDLIYETKSTGNSLNYMQKLDDLNSSLVNLDAEYKDMSDLVNERGKGYSEEYVKIRDNVASLENEILTESNKKEPNIENIHYNISKFNIVARALGISLFVISIPSTITFGYLFSEATEYGPNYRKKRNNP